MWMNKRNHRFASRSSQAAKALGVTLLDKMFEPPSVYDARQWSVEVWKLADGRVLVISGDNSGFDTAILSGPVDLPCTAYGRKSEQQAIAAMAGLHRGGSGLSLTL